MRAAAELEDLVGHDYVKGQLWEKLHKADILLEQSPREIRQACSIIRDVRQTARAVGAEAHPLDDHWLEARSVEEHQERKHTERDGRA